MSAPAVESRFTLRDLPFPAKLVITCFLLSVGLGYTSAMVQLHFQDSKSGEMLPMEEDVVLKFTGKKWFQNPPPPPVSKLVQLITTSSGTFGSNGTMLPAFFEKDPAFSKAKRDGADMTKLGGEREGERDALVFWAGLPDEVRKIAYEKDLLSVSADKMPKSITPKFKDGDGFKVKSILEARCVYCHMKGGDAKAEAFPLENYDQVAKYLAVPEVAPFKPGWVKVEEGMSLEKLTQSTHAHLLSFAVLFSLTGLVFAFTSYPAIVRCAISPLVLLAIVTDVSFWWLARLSEGYGVYFAKGVMVTGGVAGMGLGLQITVSLWNMYGPKGKAVIVLLFALGGAIGGLVMVKVILPGLEAKKAEAAAKVKAEGDKKAEVKPEIKPPEKKPDEIKKPDDKKGTEIPMPRGLSKMDEVLRFPLKGEDGMELAIRKMPFSKKEEPKNMVRAFFDKNLNEDEFVIALKAMNLEAQKKLTPERFGELAAMTAWTKLPDAERKKAYEADAFDLPPDLAKKPFTAGYLKNGKVTIQAIFTDRCIRCHADEENAMFKDYETLRAFLEPKPPEK
ncbi:MAG: hypothetical protein K8U57_04600 [Planctomycetes bacterium]|nr:hypothetical protein [Planctomycetota bacterium]